MEAPPSLGIASLLLPDGLEFVRILLGQEVRQGGADDAKVVRERGELFRVDVSQSATQPVGRHRHAFTRRLSFILGRMKWLELA